MDQVKIGKFIAQCRKNKNLTQVELARQLGTTDKSVSKWENGYCLPDASLYEPLCHLLDISINDLFAGQKIADDDYRKCADENLLALLKHHLYDLSDKTISFKEFDDALNRISETTILLNSFKTKDDAIDYLVKETHLSLEECTNAYDIYIDLFKINN